ncbi:MULTISPECIES: glycosyltransferase family 2 protein [Sphingobacterium]|uniref:Glycosyltransferase family 2 protein n=1 Tax=Sphingobacterium populi TaxID=1812824 RepID=A0ABW5UAZ2_9SPHI|nr:glycosyltransferase family 2 protein [Sphingobacterium sp. CFCC 11742]
MELQKPKVSIISGYYNREDYVQESIQSLLDQTFTDFEIIIFDDCSTDSTRQKLRRLAATDSRIVLILHEQNQGFVNGIIDAVAIAKGDYIAIHGSGDFSLPERIEKQVEVLDQSGSIGLVGCYVENIELNMGFERVTLWKHDVTGKCIDLLNKQNLFTHGEVMFKRALYNQAGGYRSFFKFTQDYDLWTRMAIHSEFFTIPEVLYRRYLRRDGASVVPEKRLLQSLLAVIVRQNIRFIKKGKPDLVDEYGNQAIDYITEIPKKSAELLTNRTLEVLIEKGKKSVLARRVIFLFSKQRDYLFLGVLLRTLVLLPQSFIERLAKNSVFKYILSVTIYKLP